MPQNPTLPVFEEHSEGESPTLEALDTGDLGEEEPEAPLGDTLRVSTTAPAPEPTQRSEASSPGRTIPSTSTGPALSSEELAVLKKDNPLAYLNAIINARGSSTKKSVSTSTASGNLDPNNALLKKLKAKFFDVDLFQVLKNNNLAIYDLRDLLEQVDLLSITPEIVEMVTELGLMVESVSNELARLQQVTEVIESKSKDQTSAWDEATASTNKVVALEEENRTRKDKVAAHDQNIATWKEEIKVLEEKILAAWSQKEELLSFDAGAIQQEIQRGLQHVEKAQALGHEIDDVVRSKVACEKWMDLQRSKYLKMKASLPF